MCPGGATVEGGFLQIVCSNKRFFRKGASRCCIDQCPPVLLDKIVAFCRPARLQFWRHNTNEHPHVCDKTTEDKTLDPFTKEGPKRRQNCGSLHKAGPKQNRSHTQNGSFWQIDFDDEIAQKKATSSSWCTLTLLFRQKMPRCRRGSRRQKPRFDRLVVSLDFFASCG
jgi:hypothetical protein